MTIGSCFEPLRSREYCALEDVWIGAGRELNPSTLRRAPLPHQVYHRRVGEPKSLIPGRIAVSRRGLTVPVDLQGRESCSGQRRLGENAASG